MRLVLAALLAAAPASAFAIDLAVGGSCPGPMTLTVTGAVPGGSVGLISANAVGGATVPSGPCAGAPLHIGPAGLKLRGVLPTGGGGTAGLAPTIPAPACGAVVQAIDLASCDVSPARALAGGGGGNELIIADGRLGAEGTGLYSVDLDSGALMPIAVLDEPLTGLSFAPDGALWGVTAAGFVGEATIVQADPASGALTPMFSGGDLGAWSGFAWNAAAGALFMWTESGDSMHEVNPASGAVSGPLISSSSFGHCMATDADGRMFRVAGNGLYSLNPFTGVEVSLGAVDGLPFGTEGQGCAFHDGLLMVAPSDGGPRILYAVDVDAGSATSTGIELPGGIDAIASATP